MKRIFLIAFAALMVTGLYSFNEMRHTYSNIFTRLGLDTEEAESYITGNLTGGSSTFPTTKIMAKLAFNKRAEAITEIGDYIKSYVQTPAFAKEYSITRLELKPEPPPPLYQDDADIKTYKEDLKRWETEYPSTVKALIKKKLNEFLMVTANVDYAAKLQKQGDKMIFSNPAYEAKDEFWKACFRSGKTTVDVARTYAQQWLKEIQ